VNPGAQSQLQGRRKRGVVNTMGSHKEQKKKMNTNNTETGEKWQNWGIFEHATKVNIYEQTQTATARQNRKTMARIIE